MFKSGGNQTEPAKEEKKPVFVSSEQNYQETADEHVSDNEERKEWVYFIFVYLNFVN